jgi:hypothetical protein
MAREPQWIARGDEGLGLTVEFLREVLGREPTQLEQTKARRFLTQLTRRLSQQLWEETNALLAQSEQTVRHARLRRRSSTSETPPVPSGPESHIEFVARLLAAGAKADLDAISALVPNSVEWRPHGGGASQVNDEDTFDAFWAAPQFKHSVPRAFHQRGDSVVVELEPDPVVATGTALWLVFCFDGGRLLSASACPGAAEVERELAALQPSR